MITRGLNLSVFNDDVRYSMSEEMKLLMALCDALGFAVVVERDYDERKVTGCEASRINAAVRTPSDTGRGLRTKEGIELAKDEQGMYTSYLLEPITSYKLLKN
jgi:hypothetical protein